MLDLKTDFNLVNITVAIEVARIDLYKYESIENKKQLVFTMEIAQNDHSVKCEESPLANKYCAICNDVFWALIKHADSLWPLGQWSKQRGYSWHYMSTREDEVKLLKELSEKYYGNHRTEDSRTLQPGNIVKGYSF